MAFTVANNQTCCAVLEIKDISTLRDAAEVIQKALPLICSRTLSFEEERPFITFTSVEERHGWDHTYATKLGYGKELADYIEQYKLGTVYRDIPTGRNVGGNIVKIWVWYPNYAALAKLLREQQARRDAEVVVSASETSFRLKI